MENISPTEVEESTVTELTPEIISILESGERLFLTNEEYALYKPALDKVEGLTAIPQGSSYIGPANTNDSDWDTLG